MSTQDPALNAAPPLAPDTYEQNFADIAPPFSPRQAAIEAHRCLYCFDAPCIQACPTHIDVPAFIQKIATNNILGSARTILSANILGHSCGRVCPTEVLCEGACVMHEKGEPPIEIGRLQRYSVDYALDHNAHFFQAGAPNGKRVACIGAGPSSLACGAELAKMGYEVILFDRNELPGGLNTYGIAAYKMRAADAIRETDLVKQLGVKFRMKTEIGRDVDFEYLEGTFDAIFIGAGLGETWPLDIPGRDLSGVWGAIEFIEQTKARPFQTVRVGRRLACIGAGNTAIDVVTAARRLGADPVYLIYRRAEGQMSAFSYEYQLAKLDAITFCWNTLPVRVLGTNGMVTGLECVRTQPGPPDEKGRHSPVAIPGSEFTLDLDMVVLAVGQRPITDFLKPIRGLELEKNGTIKINERHQTGHAKYFAGGDCTNGGREVVDAVAEGMAAARGIDAWLGAPRASAGSGR